MSCELNRNIELGCRDIGGVKELYIGNWVGDDLTYTVTDGLITSFTAPVGYTLYTFPQPLEVAEWTSNVETSIENCTTFYTHNVGMTFYQLSADTNDIINTLCVGRFLIIVLDNNGKYFLLGYQFGATVKVASIGAGRSLSDLNGARLEFETKEKIVPYEVSTDAFASITTTDLTYEITFKPSMTVHFLSTLSPTASGFWDMSYSRVTASFVSTLGLKAIPLPFATPTLFYNDLNHYIGGSSSYATLLSTSYNNPFTRLDYQPYINPLLPLVVADKVICYFENGSSVPYFTDNGNNTAYDNGIMILNSDQQELLYYGQSDISISPYTSTSTSITLILTHTTPPTTIPELVNPRCSWTIPDGTYSVYPLDPLNSILWTVDAGVHTIGLRTRWTVPGVVQPNAYRSMVVTVT